MEFASKPGSLENSGNHCLLTHLCSIDERTGFTDEKSSLLGTYDKSFCMPETLMHDSLFLMNVVALDAI